MRGAPAVLARHVALVRMPSIGRRGDGDVLTYATPADNVRPTDRPSVIQSSARVRSWEACMRRNIGLAVALSLALTVTAACAGSGSDSGGGAKGDQIPLGFVYQGGGGFNNLSLSFVHGIQVAADEVNKAGGIKVGGKTYTFTVDTCNDH